MTQIPRALGSFFAAGQVLPTFRLHKDPRGGLFQPSISEAISLLDAPQHHWMHIFPEGRVSFNPPAVFTPQILMLPTGPPKPKT